MTTKSTIRTTDLFPDLTPLERQVLFFENLTGQKLSQAKYRELLAAHFKQQKHS